MSKMFNTRSLDKDSAEPIVAAYIESAVLGEARIKYSHQGVRLFSGKNLIALVTYADFERISDLTEQSEDFSRWRDWYTEGVDTFRLQISAAVASHFPPFEERR
jgi:hypothetical protein